MTFAAQQFASLCAYAGVGLVCGTLVAVSGFLRKVFSAGKLAAFAADMTAGLIPAALFFVVLEFLNGGALRAEYPFFSAIPAAISYTCLKKPLIAAADRAGIRFEKAKAALGTKKWVKRLLK